MNVMHSNMEITDEFYSNLNDNEVQNRIGSLGKKKKSESENEDNYRKFQEFIEWQKTPEK